MTEANEQPAAPKQASIFNAKVNRVVIIVALAGVAMLLFGSPWAAIGGILVLAAIAHQIAQVLYLASYRRDYPDAVKYKDAPRSEASQNPYLSTLLWGGIGALAIGVIIAIWAGRVVSSEAFSAELYAAISGSYFVDYSDAAAATFWMWFGVGVSVLGVALLVVYISVRAVRHPQPPAATEPVL